MKVSELKTEMDAQFDHVEEQFRDVDRRFEAVDRRFEAVDRQFEQVDARFDSLERRIDERHDEAKRYMKVLLDDAVARMSARLDGLPAVTGRVDHLESVQQTSLSVLDGHELRILALERRRR